MCVKNYITSTLVSFSFCGFVSASEFAIRPIQPINGVPAVQIRPIDSSWLKDQDGCDIRVIVEFVLNGDRTVKSARVLESNASKIHKDLALKEFRSWRFRSYPENLDAEFKGQYVYYPEESCISTFISDQGHSHNKSFKHAPSGPDRASRGRLI